MQNKILILLVVLLSGYSTIALADEIIVEDADTIWDLSLDNNTDRSEAPGNEIIVAEADTVWNLTLDNATSIGRLVGEPGVMVTKYADTLTYYLLENATSVGRLVGEPGVMVTKYADTLTYYLLENATSVGRLVGEPGVMVTKYADTLTYYLLENATSVGRLVGEPGVMITRYADTFSYSGLTSPPFDFTKPVISNVTVTNITSTSATVNWVTDEVADSLVKYGNESENYTLQKYDPTNVTLHSVDLTGLLPNTTYYFIVNSTDLNRNSNESTEYCFTTKETGGLCGDVNSNGIVNMDDTILLLERVGKFSAYQTNEDVNCDGEINMGDVILLLNHVVGDPDEYELGCCE
ncbi:hypothetical protein FHEFKHOI_01634 [Candidatus Methanoperedenaceae archaeon GB50]|nr:hypothetical protein FHEFKHOI_01634 [Candidatus Methanoperedenaceae archaeon GB50]